MEGKYGLTNLPTNSNKAEMLNKCAKIVAACHYIHSIVDFSEIWIFFIGVRRLVMKTVATSAFILITTATSSLAWGEGGCASKNKANLQAMSCATGYSWSEEAGECVQDVSA